MVRGGHVCCPGAPGNSSNTAPRRGAKRCPHIAPLAHRTPRRTACAQLLAQEARHMKIGMIAPPWFPLPPKGYGGIELVVHLLTEGLVARGHDVTLFASGDSETLARLSFVYSRAPSEKIATHGHIEIIHGLEAYSRARDFDVIH